MAFIAVSVIGLKIKQIENSYIATKNMSKINNCLKKLMVFINKDKLIKKAPTIFLHKLNTKY